MSTYNQSALQKNNLHLKEFNPSVEWGQPIRLSM